MIVFLSINSKASPFFVFSLINATDLFCLIISGPFAAFFEKNNSQILKEHKEEVDTDPFNEALGMFTKWVKVISRLCIRVKDQSRTPSCLSHCSSSATARFLRR